MEGQEGWRRVCARDRERCRRWFGEESRRATYCENISAFLLLTPAFLVAGISFSTAPRVEREAVDLVDLVVEAETGGSSFLPFILDLTVSLSLLLSVSLTFVFLVLM